MKEIHSIRSNDIAIKRAEKVMPGGVSSPVRAFRSVKGNPAFIVKAEGANIYDIEGREYIDYVMSFGPLILGHAHPSLTLQLIRQAIRGTSYGAPTLYEVELAERIIESHPATDWVRFVNSGTEAVMSAIRLARGITKRDRIVKFDGCYHGHADSLLVKAGSGLATFGIASSAGVPHQVAKDTSVLPLGDLEQFKQLMDEKGEEVAAVIIEGVPANMGLFPQEKRYMQELERISQENGSLFILDEVITGFRIGNGGASQYYELSPDLVTFGKVIGGGLPIGAYGGKKEYMGHIAPLGNVYQAGTLSGNPLAITAGIATLEAIEQEPNFYAKLQKQTNELVERIEEVFQKYSFPLQTKSIASLFWLALQTVPANKPSEIKRVAVESYSHLHFEMMKEGIYAPPSAYEVWFMSAAHTEDIRELTLQKLEQAVENYFARKKR